LKTLKPEATYPHTRTLSAATSGANERETRVQDVLKAVMEEGGKVVPNPAWFGATLAAATDNAAVIPLPFSPKVKEAVTPHLLKASIRRTETLAAIKAATGTEDYERTMGAFFKPGGLGTEGQFAFDTATHRLQEAFKRACGIPDAVDLSQVHTAAATAGAIAAAVGADPYSEGVAAGGASAAAAPMSAGPSGLGLGPAPHGVEDELKDLMMALLVEQPHLFQPEFDRFVREVCAPRLHTLFPCNQIYYQAFPCVRVVTPHEFSIGPHAVRALFS
jgi:hypothetical protein